MAVMAAEKGDGIGTSGEMQGCTEQERSLENFRIRIRRLLFHISSNN